MQVSLKEFHRRSWFHGKRASGPTASSSLSNRPLPPAGAHNSVASRRGPGRLAFAGLLSFLACLQLAAQPSVISYTIGLTDPASHLAAISIAAPSTPPHATIQFPAWNALYQMRDFVRNVQNLSAECSGTPLELHPVDVDTWETGPQACAPLVVRYQVLADEGGVFSSQLIPEHAYLNLAQLLFYFPRRRNEPCEVRFLLPTGWNLATLMDAQGGEFTAPNYDTMVDSPVEAGVFQTYSYRQGNAVYQIVVRANPGDYPAARLLESVKKITAAETALMRDQPFSRYAFIFHFPGERGGGGMEHSDGAVIGFPAPLLRDNWEGLERIIAHEFFHLWNVKRIRPQGLEPIDYVHGNDTRDLWFSEGVTSTYASLVLVRAGLIGRKDFYQHLADQIGELESRPARRFQSAELSGMDAWLEKYPDYLRPERSISYYNKGELLGDLLDLSIRHASGNAHSLDDVMRRLNAQFGKRGRCFTDADLERTISSFGPSPGWVRSFFENDVAGTQELDFEQYLAYAGLRLDAISSASPDWGFQATRSFDGAIRVETVDAVGEAARAGLEPGDRLTAIDGQPLYALPAEVTGLHPGERVVLQVVRGARTFTVAFRLGGRAATRYRIAENSDATPAEVALRDAWLRRITPGATGR